MTLQWCLVIILGICIECILKRSKGLLAGSFFLKRREWEKKNIRFCFFTTEKIAIFAIAFADMAQLVEQRIRNA